MYDTVQKSYMAQSGHCMTCMDSIGKAGQHDGYCVAYDDVIWYMNEMQSGLLTGRRAEERFPSSI